MHSIWWKGPEGWKNLLFPFNFAVYSGFCGFCLLQGAYRVNIVIQYYQYSEDHSSAVQHFTASAEGEGKGSAPRNPQRKPGTQQITPITLLAALIVSKIHSLKLHRFSNANGIRKYTGTHPISSSGGILFLWLLLCWGRSKSISVQQQPESHHIQSQGHTATPRTIRASSKSAGFKYRALL